MFQRSFTIYASLMHIPYVGSIKIAYVSLLINSTLDLAQSCRVRSLTFIELSEVWYMYNVLFVLMSLLFIPLYPQASCYMFLILIS